MQLPFLTRNEPQKNFFLSLLIKPRKVGAILFEEINSKLFILSTNETDVESDTGELSGEKLLLSADKVISFVESSLPQNSNVEKTIFSVPYDWVAEGKIKPEFLEKLKRVCKELELIPIGYLISIEAIVAFLQGSEGAPISAIFVEIIQDRVIIYLVRAGKILEVHSGNVEENVLKTTSNLFKKINSVDVLPSKIILLDYKGAEGIQQEFLSHSWPKEIPFLHLPQVVILEKGFENEATVNGVANQMQLEVLSDVKTGPPEPSQEILEQTGASELGFYKEKDIMEKSSENSQDGNQDGRESVNSESPEKSAEELSISYFREDQDGDKEDISGEMKKSNNLPALKISSFLKLIPSPRNLLNFNFTKIGSFKIKAIAGLVGLVVFLFILSFVYYNFILKASITIFADRKAIDKTVSVTFSADRETSKDVINLQLLDEEMRGEESKNSTGKKETGDKARGEITIFNKTESKKTFPKGAIVIGPNDLEFDFQEDVSVASTSSFSTTLSTAKGKVLALKFGKEYNLPSSSNFTMKGFPSANYIGKNSDAITGGTKKETTVVSSKDLDDLLVSLSDKLEKEVVLKAGKNGNQEAKIFPKALSSEVVEKKYSKKEGEESGNVSLSATIIYSLGKYKKQDLQKIIEVLSEGEVPGSYSIREGDSNTEIADIKINGKNQNASAKLKINAVFTPNIDKSALSLLIKGKSYDSAKKQIETIPGITDVLIRFNNKLPFFPQNLPQNPKNISIEISN